MTKRVEESLTQDQKVMVLHDDTGITASRMV